MLDNLLFAFSVTAPIFFVFCVGIALKRLGIINNEFAQIGSDLAFKIALPCMLFTKLSQVSFNNPPLTLLVYALLATTGVFLILDRWIAPSLDPANRSAFVQGAFRSNMGIVGLAFSLNAYGEGILPIASIYLAALTILYNVLSVITLNRHQPGLEQQAVASTVLRKLLSNPLIIAIILALIVSWRGIPVPRMVLQTMGYFADLALPLALLCAGAAIRWREFHTSVDLYWCTFAKLVFVPGTIVLGGVLVGLRGEELGLLFFMAAAPTATASYPMIRSMGGNHYLASAIIATTSLASVIAVTLGLFLLRGLGLA